MEVEYKDNLVYLSEIDLLHAKYYAQKKNFKKANEEYLSIILIYPKTVASSDASYALADYYENQKGDYLNALRYYRYSSEESSLGHFASIANSKLKTFKRYFELMSVIAGEEINTDYDTSFLNLTRPPGYENIEPGFEKEGEEKKGRPGGWSLSPLYSFADSLQDSQFVQVDSAALITEKIAKAKFELAELFVYDLNKTDSAEKYLWSAYEQSEDSNFKGTVLFTLSGLYRGIDNSVKADEILRTLVEEYPLSEMANESRKLLNLPLVEASGLSPADSIYSSAENYFVTGNYDASMNSFMEIINNYPDSKHIDRANYAAGWIYENVRHKYDSAYYYYSKLAEKSPNSEYSLMITGKLQEYRSANGAPPDSLKNTDTTKIEQQEIEPQKQTPEKIDETGDDPLKQDDPIKKEEDPIKEPGTDNK
jgi:TolA-binding protein